jgi:parallel beta-helix repeat protein
MTGNTYYVSASGDDGNDGLSLETPFGTLQHAADIAQPGDTVYVTNGIYTPSNPGDNVVTIYRSGAPGKPITFKAYPGHRPIIRATGHNGFKIYESSHIVIDGFEIEGNRAQTDYNEAYAARENSEDPRFSNHGIESYNAHHITYRNNIVHDVNGNGLAAVRSDYVIIEDNVVYNNAWYSPWANSGITVYQGINTDNNTTDYKVIVRRNISHSNQNLIPFFIAGEITDGNGIIIDDTEATQGGAEPYLGRILVENNLVYNNGGRGIHAFYSNNIDIVNNTTYQNSRHPEIDDGEITTIYAKNVNVLNNIMYGQKDIAANDTYETENVIFDYNLIFNASSFESLGGQHNIIGRDPLFDNPAAGIFALQPNSPAIDAGVATVRIDDDLQGFQRPMGAGIDIGALEYSNIPATGDENAQLGAEGCYTPTQFGTLVGCDRQSQAFHNLSPSPVPHVPNDPIAWLMTSLIVWKTAITKLFPS